MTAPPPCPSRGCRFWPCCPGPGGLTRVTDKRKVRRDRADVFCTTAEGIKGKRAVDWRLVDAVVPRSQWAETVKARADKLAATASGAAPGTQKLAATASGATPGTGSS